ncbi:UNVERIFIED_CONTAM: hypothetical protein NY603_34165, partial [Bacteroidetes bacterium 56_B9]
MQISTLIAKCLRARRFHDRLELQCGSDAEIRGDSNPAIRKLLTAEAASKVTNDSFTTSKIIFLGRF